MATLVLTVIGDDRTGLVAALADVVTTHGGNWEQSQMAELAGKFAGIVTVDVPDAQADALTKALKPLEGLLDITLQAGTSDLEQTGTVFALDLVGNDHPGIVQEITAVLRRHNVSIDQLATSVVDAPMAGGRLFEAHATLRLPEQTASADLSADLERLATELMVDLTLDPTT